MEVFLKSVIGVLIAVILYQTLSKQDKTVAILLIIAVCAMIFAVISGFWREIISFISHLEMLGDLNHEYVKIMLKAVGIGLLSDISSSVCTDAGNASLGKVLQMLSSAVILWLSLPLFTELISLAEKILGVV